MKKLNEMTVADLRNMAKELNVKGGWNMTKGQLIKAIEEIAQDVPEVVEAEPNVNTPAKEENAPEANQDKSRKNQKRLIEYNGKTQTLTAWAKELGVRHQTLYNRIVMKGMDPAEAFEMPLKKGAK